MLAVIAPDLRGHGDSTQVRDSNRSLRAADMPPAAFAGMEEDVEAVKRFLMAKNNAGELNIDKLCIIGADMGGLVAANWAITDWDWPPLAVGKQGQDVKALVLLSPPEKFKSLRMIEPLADRMVRTQLAIYIAVGNDSPAAVRDAAKIHTTLNASIRNRSKRKIATCTSIAESPRSCKGRSCSARNSANTSWPSTSRNSSTYASTTNRSCGRIASCLEALGGSWPSRLSGNDQHGPFAQVFRAGNRAAIGVEQFAITPRVAIDLTGDAGERIVALHPIRARRARGRAFGCRSWGDGHHRKRARPIDGRTRRRCCRNSQFLADGQQIGAGEHVAIQLVDFAAALAAPQVALRECSQRVAINDFVPALFR